MTHALAHRGPDEEGHYVDQDARMFLGHRRLSIIDLSSGAQPLWNEDRTLAVVYNGEIYNHAELRKTLESAGHVFHTDHSDTEVLVHGYEEWGAEVVQRLNGMWAFALYDRNRGRIFLSRDRFGKKPLYYASIRDCFAFASELHALLLHEKVPRELDRLSLKKYFAYGFIPAPRTPYLGIHKLPAGHNMLFSLGSREVKVWAYWDFVIEPFDSIPPQPEEVWTEELRHLFFAAVQRRLEADVPLGVFLSGGIDSSAVAMAAARFRDPRDIKTFSIGFDEASFDETAYAKTAAGFLGTDHRHKGLSLGEAKQLVPDILRRLDEPVADGSLIPTYLLSRFTRSTVTVALSGDGGDELFAGYDPFKALRLAVAFDVLVPRAIRSGIRSLADLLPVSEKNMSLDFKIKRTLRGLSYDRAFWNPVWLSPLEPKEIDDLFQERTDIEELYSEAMAYWRRFPGMHIVDKTLYFYTKMYLQDDILPKVDRAAMMVSLEVRSPFLDTELVDFVRRIPWRWKLGPLGKTKAVLKRSLRGRLPDSILNRRKKGFGIPLTSWLQETWHAWKPATHFKEEDFPLIRAAAADHLGRRKDHRLFLWASIVMDHCLLSHGSFGGQ